jgi:transposase
LPEEKAREVKRVQKTLEETHVPWGDVVSDLMGKASRLILQAIAAGETDPVRLAALAVGRVRAPQEALEAALKGHVSDHHRFLLGEHLRQIQHLEQAIDRVTAEIPRRLTAPPPPEELPASEQGGEATPERAPVFASQQEEPFPSSHAAWSWAHAVVLLWSIPGISERNAMGILAEIGVPLQQLPTAAHLASGAGVCPGNHESAGKRLSGKTRKGNPW